MSFIYFSIMKTWCWIGSDYDLFREEMINVWYYYFYFLKHQLQPLIWWVNTKIHKFQPQQTLGLSENQQVVSYISVNPNRHLVLQYGSTPRDRMLLSRRQMTSRKKSNLQSSGVFININIFINCYLNCDLSMNVLMI